MTQVADNFPVFTRSQRQYLGWKRFGRAIALRGLLFHSVISVSTINRHLIPTSGPTLIMMNHQGGLDPVVVMGAVGPRYLCVMSKIENFGVPFVSFIMRRWGCYPIRRGLVDRRALEYTLKILAEGEMVLIAPEGTRSDALQEAKDGLAYLAIKSGAAIVPVGLRGTREADRRLKARRFLPPTPVSLTFGRAFRFKARAEDRVPRAQMAQMTREAMYQLAALLDESQRGFYADLSQATTDTLDFVT